MAASSSTTTPARDSFSHRISYEIPGVYRINFANSARLLEILSTDHSPIADFFRSAMHGEFRRNQVVQSHNESITNLQAQCKRLVPIEGSDEIIESKFQRTIAAVEKARARFLEEFEVSLQSNDGYDVLTIKQMVHHILGIENRNPIGAEELSSEEKSKYYTIMKEVEFLNAELPLNYDSGKLICKILEENPSIDSLLVGCGRSATNFSVYMCGNENDDRWSGSASFRKKKEILGEHTQSALTLDIATQIDPDVIADIFDPEMLEQIPTERIRLISDHSNGHLNLGDSQNAPYAFDQYFRILIPGGHVELVGSIDRNHQEIFEKIGFIVDPKKRSLRKPNVGESIEKTTDCFTQ